MKPVSQAKAKDIDPVEHFDADKDDQPEVIGTSDGMLSFTGVSRSLVCDLQHGTWNNFRILTIKIENGVVKEVIQSDPYCQMEAQQRIERDMIAATDNLRAHYEHGRAWAK